MIFGGRQPCTGKTKPIRSSAFNAKLQSPVVNSEIAYNVSCVSCAIFCAAHLLFPVPDKDRIAKKFIRDAQYYRGED